jgi:replicative DNA helicase
MTLQRKQTKKKEVVKLLDISIPSNILDVLLGYLLYYPQMDKEVATSIYYLFIKINKGLYIDNIYLELKFDLILFVSELIVKKNITSNKLIEGAIETKFITEYLEELDEVLDICHELVDPDNFKEADVNYIIEYINERSTYIAIYENKDLLDHLMHKLNVNDTDNFMEYAESLLTVTQKISKGISNSKTIKTAKRGFTLGRTSFETEDSSFRQSLSKTLDEIHSPSNTIHTGLQQHNSQLNGGWKSSTVYLYLGITNGGKSVLLLQSLKWFLRYNRHIVCRNTRLKPLALYITLEDNVDVVTERLFELFVDEDTRNKNSLDAYKDKKEVERLISEAMDFQNHDLHIHIEYRKNKSITVTDIELMMDDLEEQGFETKLVVLDYIKRINPIEYRNDMRLDLAECMNDLVYLANSRKVPVVTASQLNRNGISLVEDAVSKNKVNIVQEIGAKDVGESSAMIENSHYVYAMYNEFSQSTNKKYITFKEMKKKGKSKGGISFFAQPYISSDSIIIDEDYGLKKSKAILNLGDGLENFNKENTNKTRTTRNLKKDSISEDKTILYQSMSDEKNFE